MDFLKMFLNNYRRNYRLYFSRIYRRNEMSNFFYVSVPSVNPSVIIFFFITNGFTDEQKITDERFIDGAFPSGFRW